MNWSGEFGRIVEEGWPSLGERHTLPTGIDSPRFGLALIAQNRLDLLFGKPAFQHGRFDFGRLFIERGGDFLLGSSAFKLVGHGETKAAA